MTALSLLLSVATLFPGVVRADPGAACAGECDTTYKQYLSLYCGQPAATDACNKNFSRQYTGLLTRWGQVCADKCGDEPDWLRDSCEDKHERECAVYAEVSKSRPGENLYSEAEWAQLGAKAGFSSFLAQHEQDLADYKCGRTAAGALYKNFSQELYTSRGLQNELARETDTKNGVMCQSADGLPAAKGFFPSFGHKRRSHLTAGDLIKVYLGDKAYKHLLDKVAFLKRLEKGGQASDAEKAQFFSSAAVNRLNQSGRLKKNLGRAQKSSEADARLLESGRTPLTLAGAAAGAAGAPADAAPAFWMNKSEAGPAPAKPAPALSDAERANIKAGLARTETSVDLSLNDLSYQEGKLKKLQQTPPVSAALKGVTDAEGKMQNVKNEISAALNNPSQAALNKANGDYAAIDVLTPLQAARKLTSAVPTVDEQKPSAAAVQALGQLGGYQDHFSGKDKSNLFDPKTVTLVQAYAKLKDQPLQGAQLQESQAITQELKDRVVHNCGRPGLPWKQMGDFLKDNPDMQRCAWTPGGGHSPVARSAGENKKEKPVSPAAATGMKADASWSAGDETVSQYQKNQLGDGSEMTVTWAPKDKPQDAYDHFLRIESGRYGADANNYILQPGAVIEYKSPGGQPRFYQAYATVFIPKNAPDDEGMADRGGLKPIAAPAGAKGSAPMAVSLGDRMERVDPRTGAVSEIDWQNGSQLKVDASDGRGQPASIQANGQQYEIQGPAKLTMRAGNGAPIVTIVGDKEQKCVQLQGGQFAVSDCGGSSSHWWQRIFSALPQTVPPY